MDSHIIEEILDEFDSVFQNADTGTAALRVLKEKGIANDDELAPYLEEAATASSVKWRATRLRLARLLESAAKSMEDELTEQQRKAQAEAAAAEQYARKSRRTHPKPERKAETKRDGKEGAHSETPAKPEAQDRKQKPSTGKETKPDQEKHLAEASQHKSTATPSDEKREPRPEQKERRSEAERNDSREATEEKPAVGEQAGPETPSTTGKGQPAAGKSSQAERKPA